MVSVGQKHVKFWSVCGNMLSGKSGENAVGADVNTHLCLTFGQDKTTYTGTLAGDINKWQGRRLVATIAQAHAGAIFSMQLQAKEGEQELTILGYCTGGKDGVVRLWTPEFKPHQSIDLKASSVLCAHFIYHLVIILCSTIVLGGL